MYHRRQAKDSGRPAASWLFSFGLIRPLGKCRKPALDNRLLYYYKLLIL